jgi:hypothetical protein
MNNKKKKVSSSPPVASAYYTDFNGDSNKEEIFKL